MATPRIVLAGKSPVLQGLQWESDSSLKIGRIDSADIVLHDYSVGRQHAEVLFKNRQWVIRDLARNQRTPTLVNGQLVGTSDTTLHQDDLLQCGYLALQVTVLEGAPLSGTANNLAGAKANGPGSLAGSHIRTTGSFVRVETVARRSWDEAIQAMTGRRESADQQDGQLLTLLRAGHHLSHLASLDELLQSILADALVALKCQRGSIMLVHSVTGELQLRTVLAPLLPSGQLRCYCRTMAERCFDQGESLLCTDVNAESDLLSARSVRAGTMTSLICALLRSPRKRLGVLHLDRGPNQVPFNDYEFHLADAIAANVAIGIESAQLVEEQREQFVQTVTSLARAVEVRDYSTGNTRRVTEYSLLLADELKVTPTERYHIQIGTPLHDIGKIGIDDAVLRKPDRLTPEEFEHMKLHTIKGAAILESINALNPVIPIIRNHHERWDGGGYPDGLHSDRIARTARIVAVADAFDAMTSDRPYRPAMTAEEAFEELLSKSGSHFDPACVQAFVRMRPYVEQVMKGK
jgi:HD-GYP domain-containing protein (c-di-GMP phosphodiesterase class II)